MNLIHQNFGEIEELFDTLLVDAYGVFWGSKSAIPESLERMARQVRLGKRVCILSNTTVLGEPAAQSYEQKGILKGTHFTDIVTSGDVFYYHLMCDKLPCAGHNLYPVGVMRWSWENIPRFKLVSKLSQADMLFFGTPQIFREELKQHPEYHSIAHPTRSDPKCYNLTDLKPFERQLEELVLTGLPAVSTNPDLIALENGYWVVRQGSVAEKYRQLGGQVFEFGKPYRNMYEYAFRYLGIEPSKRTAMIGDTYRTDIRGALDSGITPVWCLDWGVAKYEEEHGHPLIEQAGGSLDGIILIHHL